LLASDFSKHSRPVAPRNSDRPAGEFFAQLEQHGMGARQSFQVRVRLRMDCGKFMRKDSLGGCFLSKMARGDSAFLIEVEHE
jgi:hypothetical protein